MIISDLDDISQPDNGTHFSAVECEITDSDSDVSCKDEYIVDETPPETPYVPNMEEEFGDVIKYGNKFRFIQLIHHFVS